MSPQAGLYTKVDADADIAVHAAVLDAHFEPFNAESPVGQYLPPMPVSDIADTSISTGVLYSVACRVPRDMTFDRITIQVRLLSADKSARLGIYNMGSDGKPSSLILDAGEVSVATTGLKVITIDQQLTKGWYYVAAMTNGSPKIPMGRAAYSFLGFGITCLFTAGVAGYIRGKSYGALPDPFGTAGLTESSSLYLICLRIKSLD